MIYSDPTNKQGVLDLARFHVKADENKFTAALGRAFINAALDDYLELALFSSGFWRADDPNHGDEAYTDINLVAGTAAYLFPSDLLTLDKVEVLDSTGETWTEVTIVQKPNAPSEKRTDGGGIPITAYADGAYLVLHPAPNYNQAAGLRVHHSRQFVYWDGTATDEAGIPPVHHKYLAIRAAYLYAVRETLSSRKDIGELMVDAQNKVKNYYARRNRPIRKTLRPVVTPST